MSLLSSYILDSGHHVVEVLVVDTLDHRRLASLLSLHLQTVYQWSDGDPLKEDGEVDDCDGRRDEHRLGRYRDGDRDDETVGDGPSKPSIGHDELIDHLELFGTESVENRALNDDPDGTVYEAEKQRGTDEIEIKVVFGRDGRQAEEHEDDSFRGLGKHLGEVLDRVGGCLCDVSLDVLLHEHSADGNAGRIRVNQNLDVITLTQ